MKRRVRRPTFRGYTLLEITISMPLMALLLLGMASAIGLASRAVPSADTGPSAVLAVWPAIDMLSREIRYCTSVSVHTPTQLQFVAPDRGAGSAGPEIVQYSWSGTAGAPLTRQVNGSEAETLVTGVQNFQLNYRTRLDAATGLQYLQAIEICLECQSPSSARLDTQVRLVSEPQY